jgi:hypothetical protein
MLLIAEDFEVRDHLEQRVTEDIRVMPYLVYTRILCSLPRVFTFDHSSFRQQIAMYIGLIRSFMFSWLSDPDF